MEVVELDDKLSVVEVDSSDSESETLVQIPLQFVKDYPTLEETSDAPEEGNLVKEENLNCNAYCVLSCFNALNHCAPRRPSSKQLHK
ncbi:uncharacterized protein G2W53_015062 [Senna tora]|uniref:Uncharacterized protein n=1 Tax=Senna tora TaxID=362788 RepID=A0A834WUW6_9FABA|nr:uncharacterized protein G2W53_015062 [Senna tora]